MKEKLEQLLAEGKQRIASVATETRTDPCRWPRQ